VISLAVLDGTVDLDAPTFFQNRDLMLEAEWQPDGWEWIDPAKEAAAAKIKLEQRLDTRRRILNERGRSVRDVARQLADERELFEEEFGLALPENATPAPGGNPGEPRPQGEDAPPEAAPEPNENEAKGEDAMSATQPPVSPEVIA
jgi:capsid protein